MPKLKIVTGTIQHIRRCHLKGTTTALDSRDESLQNDALGIRMTTYPRRQSHCAIGDHIQRGSLQKNTTDIASRTERRPPQFFGVMFIVVLSVADATRSVQFICTHSKVVKLEFFSAQMLREQSFKN